MNFDLSNIPASKGITIIVLLITIVSPGLLAFYLLDRETFVQMEFIKLVLLSSAVSTPVWLLNTYYIVRYYDSEKKTLKEYDQEGRIYINTIVGCFFSNIFMYVPILIGYFFGVAIKQVIIIALVIQAIWIIVTIIAARQNNNKSKEA